MNSRQLAGGRAGGFTLIELMITVAIVGILAAVAVPLYRGYVDTTQREAVVAKVALFQAFEENARIDSGTYVPGTYTPGGANSFVANAGFPNLGYRVPGDGDGISFTVLACGAGAGQTIDVCYRVNAQTADGRVQGFWDKSTGVWTWTQ